MNKLKFHKDWIRDCTIGRGANGTVSLAAVQKPGSGVFAVKSVDVSCCLPNQLEALENEIEILRNLSSPYVVEYLGDGVTAEPQLMRNLYMEYLQGGSVAEMAGGGGGVEETIIRSFSFCIVSALSYLHSKGIVHCDVKGANVLVNSSSSSSVSCSSAKLADFGSAVKLELNPDHSVGIQLNNGRVMPRGSPLWMAPEVIRGEFQGPESDVWSLGCTVIEMLTGKPAWEDKCAAETLCRIGYSDELPEFPAHLSELGRDFLEKCLQREPERRWSCDQLLKHPFLSIDGSFSKFKIHQSPRSILDFFINSDEEDEEIAPSCFSVQIHDHNEEICKFEVNSRIKELTCSSEAAVWESDGWVAVRNCTEEKLNEKASISDAAGSCSGDVERTIHQNQESRGVEKEIRLTGGQFAETTWVDSSDLDGAYSHDEHNTDDDVVLSCSNRSTFNGDFPTKLSSSKKLLPLVASCLLLSGVKGQLACKYIFTYLIYYNIRNLH